MASSKTWTLFEDQALLTLYRDRKLNKWNKISKILLEEFEIRGKSPKQCRQRYKNHLDPQIKKDDWTIDQQKQLVDLHDRMGNRWAQISRKLQGRTENAVKNKFFSKFRKAIKNINKLGEQSKKIQFRKIQICFAYKLTNLIDHKYKHQFFIAEQLLQEAENLKQKIFQYQNLSAEGYQMQHSQLNSLFQKVHYVNSQLKKKAGRRKRARVSNNVGKQKDIIKNKPIFITDHSGNKSRTHQANNQHQDNLFQIKNIDSPFSAKLFQVQQKKLNRDTKEIKEDQLDNVGKAIVCRWDQQQSSDLWKIPRQRYKDSSQYFG